ncbi:MAG: DUF4869 domain-containing protein [Lachnospiraceae bacterium]|nr:DUF4869 domain-containing protein [Lachnospiraceae bacterium]
MLNVFFGNMPEAIYDTATYFKHAYKDKWITDPMSVEMIRDVDRSEVVSANLIQSPVLGPISPHQLSGGVKTLILINKEPGKVFNASKCGDNCAKWLLKMAEKKKVVINLRHIMNFGGGEFKIRVINRGRIATNMRELVLLAGEYV